MEVHQPETDNDRATGKFDDVKLAATKTLRGLTT
jgi:hypothetical protein